MHLKLPLVWAQLPLKHCFLFANIMKFQFTKFQYTTEATIINIRKCYISNIYSIFFSWHLFCEWFIRWWTFPFGQVASSRVLLLPNKMYCYSQGKLITKACFIYPHFLRLMWERLLLRLYSSTTPSWKIATQTWMSLEAMNGESEK